MNNEELSQMIDKLSQVAAEEVKKEYDEKSAKIEEDELILKIENIQKEKALSTHDKQHLLNIKERILVLFEALNAKQSEEDLQKRLELTISFIEFLLAHIEERLKD